MTTKAPAQDISLPDGFLGQKVIVLDPGHGGHDSGATGPSGLTEKSVALALAKKLKDTLAGDYSVHLTRNGNYRLNIEKRTAIANQRRADIFISLHAAGSFHHKARGMAVYSFGRGTGAVLATQLGSGVVETWEKVRPWDDIQSMHAAQSRRLASLVHGQLVSRLNPIDGGIHQAPCLVLRGVDMPAILVEIGYVSHPAEERELRDSRIISAFAEAIGEGIREFFRETSG